MSNFRKIVKPSGIADQIALFVSNESMRKLGWSSQPELFLESFRVELLESYARDYEGNYPLFGNRVRSYGSNITLFKDNETNKWARGNVRMEHMTGKWVYWATFVVTWSDNHPRVTVSEFAQIVSD